MYLCPRCELEYKPNEVPANCTRCKRPLILQKRFRIECAVDTGPGGEDFDVVDLKTQEPVILRELRVRKDEMAQSQGVVDTYQANLSRLKEMKYDGKSVLIDAWDQEFKNNHCYYFVFNTDAWASLGPELYDDGSGDEGGGEDEYDFSDLDELFGAEGDDGGGGSRDGDAGDLDALLADLEKKADSGGGGKKKKKEGALVKSDGDKSPAKKESGGGMSKGMKIAVAGGGLLVIIAVILAILL